MKLDKEIHALVIEKDAAAVAAAREIMEGRSYTVSETHEMEEAKKIMKEQPVTLAIAGQTAGSDSPFQIMKAIVMTSPMTAIILITDLPKQEVEEKAEGYGILGHVNRPVTPENMAPLIETFEQILGAF